MPPWATFVLIIKVRRDLQQDRGPPLCRQEGDLLRDREVAVITSRPPLPWLGCSRHATKALAANVMTAGCHRRLGSDIFLFTSCRPRRRASDNIGITSCCCASRLGDLLCEDLHFRRQPKRYDSSVIEATVKSKDKPAAEAWGRRLMPVAFSPTAVGDADRLGRRTCRLDKSSAHFASKFELLKLEGGLLDAAGT